jgi:hypothetical protein
MTYARRYGLFTLVGIAGEDDLDAPDLAVSTAALTPGELPPIERPPVELPPVEPPPTEPPPECASPPLSPMAPRNRFNRGAAKLSQSPTRLDEAASSGQRDQLLAELDAAGSFEAAALWAKRSLPVKDRLTDWHAREVERACQAKLVELGDGVDEPLAARQDSRFEVGAVSSAAEPSETALVILAAEAMLPIQVRHTSEDRLSDEVNVAAAAEVSATAPPAPNVAPPAEPLTFALPLPPRRRRDKRHRDFVAAQACLVCGREPADAHHLRFAQPHGLGLKVSDEFTVPLCRVHHREVHQTSQEAQWWARFGIEPLTVAERLWAQSHPHVPLL